ncbi:hypothetical protein STRDD13_01024 [Streptococcus sp. DD13]|nr:hypothetical protein STRDD13_01024 [Streptococcus sp. DD13]
MKVEKLLLKGGSSDLVWERYTRQSAWLKKHSKNNSFLSLELEKKAERGYN